MPALPPDGRPLIGSTVRLDPLVPADAEALFPLFADPAVYEQGYVMHGPPADVEETLVHHVERLRAPGRIPYTIRLVSDGTVVGTSSLMDVDVTNERTHIGSTLYGSRWWGTAVNPESKLLLLAHAFDDCGMGRVKIQTDALNLRSQAAIAKLGAQREGVLRRHVRRADGTFRDSVVFSILRDEWPAVRDGLRARLASDQR
ncbi:GNAT family N-acetyltransferase [Pseudonocardia sp. TRM90224]|uniref:GNAT family N-acetyltransferase n=1 Tax=Pseudonocardia sp. TRM90224 TaxID=2812678 RepID=UPI001E3746AF|nr:GNAT family protein [Pseudonocardia sp. TRM90224]